MKETLIESVKKPRLAMECSAILPEELWVDILLRLPMKYLARAKCVSKLWLSLISDPSFAQSHFDLALAPTHTLLMLSIMDDTFQIASIDFNAPLLHDDTIKLLTLPIPPPQLPLPSKFKFPQIINSCRGFLLIDYFPDFYIWNPCTGVQRKIPFPPIDMDSHREFLSGFGYDSSTGDYLVTLGCRDMTDGWPFEDHAAIFSVRANAWKLFDDTALKFFKGRRFFSHTFSLSGLFFNGAIHWIANCGPDGLDVYVIVAIDLRERVFFEIPLPDGFNGNINECELRVIGGFLSLCQVVEDNECDDEIWVMEEYKVQSSWKILFRFSGLHYRSDLYPICLTVGGDIVGIDYNLTQLVKFNDKEVLECLYPIKSGVWPMWSVVMHTLSLLSLPPYSLQAEETVNDE